MEPKQTAVEWLVQWGKENPIALQSDYYEAIKQAKEMEKQQIINAWDNGAFNLIFETAEQYYNEEYRNET